MEYRKLGKTDITVSSIALGTWAMGADSNWGESDDETCKKVIQSAFEKGINFVDTAPAYGMGHSEKIVGEAIKGFRQEIVLATKCGLVWDEEEGAVFAERDGKVIRRNLSPASIRKQLEQSLKRLGTDYIDLFITHWQSVEEFPVPVRDTMECLTELKKEGKIRAIGISNVTKEQVEEYIRYGQVDLVQEKYSLLDNTCEENGVLDLCADNRITFQAYSPLERGILAGNPSTKGNARKAIEWYQDEKKEKVCGLLEKFQPLCTKYDVEMSALILAWTRQVSENMSVLCGIRGERHLDSNCRGGEISISKQDREWMKSEARSLVELFHRK